MKKRLKMIRKGIIRTVKVMAFILFSFIIALSSIHFICKVLEEKSLRNAYGQMEKVNGKNMCVNIKGKGKQVIVILPGYGSISPVLEFAPLADKLKDDYTVITVEPFGYGLSNVTNKERTIENITQEIHTLLYQLGYKKYILMAHSLSGLYSIYYANQYPKEVEAFIGIDSSVPKQALYDEPAKKMIGQYKFQRFLCDIGIIRLLSMIDSKGVVPQIKEYPYPEDEKKIYTRLFQKVLLNNTSLNEFVMSDSNFKKSLNLSFSIPVLYFLSSENCEGSKKWYALHEDVMKDKAHSKIMVLKGTHYLQYEYVDTIASKTESFIKSTFD